MPRDNAPAAETVSFLRCPGISEDFLSLSKDCLIDQEVRTLDNDAATDLW